MSVIIRKLRILFPVGPAETPTLILNKVEKAGLLDAKNVIAVLKICLDELDKERQVEPVSNVDEERISKLEKEIIGLRLKVGKLSKAKK